MVLHYTIDIKRGGNHWVVPRKKAWGISIGYHGIETCVIIQAFFDDNYLHCVCMYISVHACMFAYFRHAPMKVCILCTKIDVLCCIMHEHVPVICCDLTVCWERPSACSYCYTVAGLPGISTGVSLCPRLLQVTGVCLGHRCCGFDVCNVYTVYCVLPIPVCGLWFRFVACVTSLMLITW